MSPPNSPPNGETMFSDVSSAESMMIFTPYEPTASWVSGGLPESSVEDPGMNSSGPVLVLQK